MLNLKSLENFFQKRINIFLIFFLFLCFQLFYSFLFPSYEDTWYWKTVEELDFYQGYTFDTFDNDILQKAYPLIANYRMNLDVGGYLLLAHDFPQHYFKGNYTMLTRPLYPIMVNLAARPLHLVSDSYSMTFTAGIIVNFILFFFTVCLFYLFVRKLISFRVAFLSSVLLIFSPLAHVWLIQPETNIFGIFAIMSGLYLLYKYVEAPSLKKLIIFSLMVGILLLGKKVFVIGILVLFLSFLFKRKKEGIIFFLLHLVPLALWFFWITAAWKLPLYVDEVSQWDYGVWFFNIFIWPWQQTLKIFIESVPKFISTVIYGFLLVPVIFAIIGYKRLVLPKKNILVFSFVFSLFVLLFGMNIYISRFGFWLFPLIYPLAVLGIDEAADFLKKYKQGYALAFQILIYSLIILISSLNIYKFVYYG